MGMVLLWTFICALALYGLILLFWQLAHLLGNQAQTRPYLSLLFVVSNQAAIIEGLIREIMAMYHASLPPFDLVIVDNTSSDETPEIIRRLNKKNAFTFIESDPDEPVLEMGLRACRGEVISYFNLAGQVNPRLVSRLARRLLRGEEIQTPLEHCAVTLVHGKKAGDYGLGGR
jgi:hypothetical protein